MLKKGNSVLDIGSNDGTFLSFFKKNLKLYACDPTIKKFKKYYRKDINLTADFFTGEKFKGLKFNLITSIAMFYDLPDPLKFANDINSVLANNGIWHIEMSYMPSMLNNNSYDTICHEHLEYYSVKSLKYLMDLANLKIINISFNQINGGSISLDVAKKKSKFHFGSGNPKKAIVSIFRIFLRKKIRKSENCSLKIPAIAIAHNVHLVRRKLL